jgi:hypothetical protein
LVTYSLSLTGADINFDDEGNQCYDCWKKQVEEEEEAEALYDPDYDEDPYLSFLETDGPIFEDWADT